MFVAVATSVTLQRLMLMAGLQIRGTPAGGPLMQEGVIIQRHSCLFSFWVLIEHSLSHTGWLSHVLAGWQTIPDAGTQHVSQGIH